MKLSCSLIFTTLALSSVDAFLPSIGQRNPSMQTNTRQTSSAAWSTPSLNHHFLSHRSTSSLLSAVTNSEIDLLEEADNIFDSIDVNSDGKVSSEELRNHLIDTMGYSADYTQYLFSALDMDSDGEITREELRFAFYNFEALAMYMTFGVGGIEVTSKDALKKIAQRQGPGSHDKLLLSDLADLIFDMIDTDESGEIDKKELLEHFEKVTAKCSEGSTADQATEYVQTMFSTLDANNDEKIQREEMRDAFQKYDFKLLAKTFGLRVYRTAEL